MINGFELFHDTRDLTYRFPFGAIAAGGSVTLSLAAAADCDLHGELSVSVHFEADTSLGHLSFDVPMDRQSVLKEGRIERMFRSEISSFDTAGVYFYYFVITKQESLQFDAAAEQIYYGNNSSGTGGMGRVYENGPIPFQITVYEKELTVPEDFLSSVIYQIFPDRFCRSGKVDIENCGRVNGGVRVYEDWYEIPHYEKEPNGDIVKWDFFGGDLYGIGEQLDYICSLGVDKLYLNPIFEASSNHRYDTANYRRIDPILGGESAFNTMMEQCKQHGVGVILDGVFSHTGCDSIYFDRFGHYGGSGAYHNPESVYRSWYRFRNGDDNDYECWWGCAALPNVNEMEPSYLEFIVNGKESVLEKWLDKGVYGFRLDVADELPDEFIGCIRRKLEEYSSPRRILIGEVWEDASNKISYGKRRTYFTKGELHSVTNYVFRDHLVSFLTGKSDMQTLWSALLSLQENYPVHNFYSLLNMTGSHDVVRLFTLLKDFCQGDEARAVRLQMEYAAVLFLFPGIPVVYYGDEVCMEGGTDPDNRRTYPWNRVKYPSVTDFFRMLGELRHSQPVLQRGILKVLTPVNGDGSVCEDIFAFERCTRNGKDAFDQELRLDMGAGQSESIICMINRASDCKNVKLSGLKAGAMYSSHRAGAVYTADENGCFCISVEDIVILKNFR